MTAPLSEQRAFYRSHPPSLLAGLQATFVEEIDYDFDGKSDAINTAFQLACPCGSAFFRVTCGINSDEDEDENDMGPPLALFCDECDRDCDVFDPDKEGWAAVALGKTLEDPEAYDDLPGEEIEAPHEVIVRYAYDPETLGAPELAGREQNAFTWFTLLARDAESGDLELLFDYECTGRDIP